MSRKKRESKKLSKQGLPAKVLTAIKAGSVDIVDVDGNAYKRVHENDLMVQVRDVETGEYKIIHKRKPHTQAEIIRVQKRRRSQNKIQEQPFVL